MAHTSVIEGNALFKRPAEVQLALEINVNPSVFERAMKTSRVQFFRQATHLRFCCGELQRRSQPLWILSTTEAKEINLS